MKSPAKAPAKRGRPKKIQKIDEDSEDEDLINKFFNKSDDAEEEEKKEESPGEVIARKMGLNEEGDEKEEDKKEEEKEPQPKIVDFVSLFLLCLVLFTKVVHRTDIVDFVSLFYCV